MMLEDISQPTRDDWFVNGEDGRGVPVMYCFALDIDDDGPLCGTQYLLDGYMQKAMSASIDDLAKMAKLLDEDGAVVVMGVSPTHNEDKWETYELGGAYRCRQLNRDERLEFERMRGLRKLRVVR